MDKQLKVVIVIKLVVILNIVSALETGKFVVLCVYVLIAVIEMKKFIYKKSNRDKKQYFATVKKVNAIRIIVNVTEQREDVHRNVTVYNAKTLRYILQIGE